MEYYNSNFKDEHQYAQDLINLGVINNQDDYLKFFQYNLQTGQEVKIAQELVSNYCFNEENKQLFALDENEIKEAKALCRVFPNYKFADIRNLYRMIQMYFPHSENKIKMILSIMSMHTEMQNKVLPENHVSIQPKALLPFKTNQSNCLNGSLYNTSGGLFGSLEVNQKAKMSIDNNYVPSGITTQPLWMNTGSSKDLFGSSMRSSVVQSCSTPSSTIVRPEMLPRKGYNSVLPQKFNQDSFNPFNPIGKVTCKPMESLVQPIGSEYKTPNVIDFTCSSSCNNVPSNPFYDHVSANNNRGGEGPGNYQMFASTSSTLPMASADPKVFQSNEPKGKQPNDYFFQDNSNECGNFIEDPRDYLEPYVFPAETMPRRTATGCRPKTAEEPRGVIQKTTKTKSPIKRPKLEQNFNNGEREYNTDNSDDENKRKPKTTRRHSRTCKCHQRKRINSSLEHARFLPDNEPIDLCDSSDTNILLSDLSDSEEDGAMAPPPEKYNNIDKLSRRNEEGKKKSKSSYCSKLSSHIMEMFPDACPNYIKELCIGKTKNDAHIGEILEIIFNEPDYPKRERKSPTPPLEMDLETQTQLLKDIFPDADPTYLESQAFIYLADPDGLREFISRSLEKHDYPTKKDYLRRQQLNAQVRQYTTEFNVDKYLDIIPDPEMYFKDHSRCTRTNDHIERHLCSMILKNLYPRVAVRDMPYTLYQQNLIIAAERLNKVRTMKTVRKPVFVDLSALQNIPLLQEIAFLINRDAILKRVADKKQQEAKEREEAKANGLMTTCDCCYDEEVMPKDSVNCENGCHFCKCCVEKSVQIAFNEGKSDFPCLSCSSVNFSLTTLKDALAPKFFSKVAQRQQLQEVKAAGIDDIVSCPFCDFATIPTPGDKIFKCLNTECMKESCRECKEPSHVPLRCDEIEKDDDVKKRTYIENKMTEALVRVCYKCGMKFIKEDGCNKMTCSCGAQMCYICLAPVTDYKHFNGQGGDQHHLCPLYSDINTMHEEEVVRGAEIAKEELGLEKSDKLKVDPVQDVHQHYDRRRKQAAPIPPGVPGLNMQPHQAFHMVVNIRQELIRVEQNRHRHRGGHRANR